MQPFTMCNVSFTMSNMSNKKRLMGEMHDCLALTRLIQYAVRNHKRGFGNFCEHNGVLLCMFSRDWTASTFWIKLTSVKQSNK